MFKAAGRCRNWSGPIVLPVIECGSSRYVFKSPTKRFPVVPISTGFQAHEHDRRIPSSGAVFPRVYG